MVPGLTTWRIDQARKHFATVGEGVYEEREPVVRYRLDGEKVDHFLDFISNPHYLQDVAYGTRKLKMSTGESIEVPDMVRTVISSRLVNLHQSYCREVDFYPLGRSTLFSILKVKYYKLHILEESPCADHCIRFSLSTDDAHCKSACDHDHSMECDRCLDTKKAPNDIIVGLDSEDICYR